MFVCVCVAGVFTTHPILSLLIILGQSADVPPGAVVGVMAYLENRRKKIHSPQKSFSSSPHTFNLNSPVFQPSLHGVHSPDCGREIYSPPIAPPQHTQYPMSPTDSVYANPRPLSVPPPSSYGPCPPQASALDKAGVINTPFSRGATMLPSNTVDSKQLSVAVQRPLHSEQSGIVPISTCVFFTLI